MNKISEIFFIVVIIFILLIILIIINIYRFYPSYDEFKILNVSKNQNKNRHISKQNGAYAHFSQITNRMPNIFEYPLYYLSNPVEYKIKKGEYLYIPKKWWHWVISIVDDPVDNYSFACNYWFDSPINNSIPYIGKFISPEENNNIVSTFDQEIKKNKSSLNLWCEKISNSTEKNSSIDNFVENKNDYSSCYMITLNAYGIIAANINNNDFFNKCKNYIPIPEVIKDKTIRETNFWLNNGNIDSGLHYDDYDGLLCVISGTKIVTLFPPSDTRYLYSYDSYEENNANN